MTDIDLNATTDESVATPDDALRGALSTIRRLVKERAEAWDEVARLTEERDSLRTIRDRLAAKIEDVADYADRTLVSDLDDDGEPLLDASYVQGANGARFDVRRRLAADPAATLAARDAEKKAEGADEERREWAGYIETSLSHVMPAGTPPLTAERVAELLRGPRPFGVAAQQGEQV